MLRISFFRFIFVEFFSSDKVVKMFKITAIFFGVFLLVTTISQSSVSEKVQRFSKRAMRKKRDTDSRQVSSVPDVGSLLQSQSTGNVQAAYFLGQCLMCPPGPQGPSGQQGPRGMPGRDGRDAILLGSLPEVSGREPTDPGDVYNASQPYVPLGAVYTRWGKSSCPNDSESIYEGAMAGSHYSHAGGAANYLCLSKEPIFEDPVAGFQNDAYLYGTEYETGASASHTRLQNAEVPCAVCLAPGKTIVLMVPGRNACPTDGRDWRLEYKGYLMSQHHTQTRTKYVCVDAEARGIDRTYGNHDGALLYIVEAQCVLGGGIPCPPYTEGYEVTCAVCTL